MRVRSHYREFVGEGPSSIPHTFTATRHKENHHSQFPTSMAYSLSATTPHGVATATRKTRLHSSSYCVVLSRPSLKPHHHPKLHFPHAKPPLKNSHSKRFIIPSAISGSSGAERSTLTEDNNDLLDSVIVFDLNGNGIPISDLWKDRKAVIAFARHFGCVLCRKRADYLASEKDKMDAAGVALVLIGPGSVDQAKAFFEQTKFKGEVYADPSYSSYKALKFVSGVTTTFTPGAALKIIEAYVEGYRQDWALSFEKDTRTRGGWQQGGILVAGPGKNSIPYIHKDKEAGNDPDIQDILKACCLQDN